MENIRENLDERMDEARQQAYQYWYEDGLSEILVGVLFLLIGLLLTLQGYLPPHPLWTALSALALPLLIVGGVYAFRWLTRRLKERITYPRTGYVAYRRERSRRRWLWNAVVVAGMGIIVALLMLSAPASLAWLPLIQGLIVGAFFLWIAHQMALVRFYGFALASVSIGAAAAWGRVADPFDTALYYAGMGVLLIFVGAVVLGNYLRRSQTEDGMADEERES